MDQPEDQEPGHDGMPAKAQQYAANLAADPSGPAEQSVEEAEAESVAKEAPGLELDENEEDGTAEQSEDDDESQSQTQPKPVPEDAV